MFVFFPILVKKLSAFYRNIFYTFRAFYLISVCKKWKIYPKSRPETNTSLPQRHRWIPKTRFLAVLKVKRHGIKMRKKERKGKEGGKGDLHTTFDH